MAKQNKPNYDLSKNSAENIELAKTLLKEGRYSAAERSFLQVVDLDAKSEYAHFELGRAYLLQNKFSEAEKEFEITVGINKKNKYAYIELGKALVEQGKYEKAEKYILQAVELDPDSKEALYVLGKVYCIKKDYSKAEKELKKVVMIDKKNIYAHIELGKALHEQGKYEEAESSFLQALKLDPKNKEAHYGLGKAYSFQNKLHGAEKELKKALREGLDNAQIHLVLAKVYDISGKDDDAIKQYKEAIKKGADNASIMLKIAELYYRSQQYRLALEECLEVRKIAPSLKVLNTLIMIYKKLKKYDLCIETGNEYMKKESEEDAKYNKKLINTFSAGKKSKDVDKELTVKIIRTPYFEKKPKDELDYCLLLPIGMSRIVSYLRSNGIEIDQDDLNIKVNNDNFSGAEKDRIDKDVFFDEKRMIAYSNGGKDPYIDLIMEKMEEKTKVKGYKVILLSMNVLLGNTSGYMFVLAYARYLKKKYNPLIMVGGHYLSINEIQNYDLKDVDLVIEGKGEKTLFKILTALRYGVSINKVPDISTGKNGKLIFTIQHTKFGIAPDYSGLSMDLYGYRNMCKPDDRWDKDTKDVINKFNNSRLLVSPFVIMEGCSHECAFCADSCMSSMLSLTPMKAVEQLKKLKEIYGINCFFFLDDTINLSKKYINDLCDEIIKSGLEILWSDCARADNLDRETILKMRKAGCIRLVYGLETASPRLLKYIDKEINLKRLENILAWTDEAGIWTGIEIICGFPHETKKDLKITTDFLNKNKRYIDTCYNNIFYLTDGAKMRSYPEKYGIKNISKTDTYQFERRELKGISRNAFDEINGLKWKAKLKQMSEAFLHMEDKLKVIKRSFRSFDMDHFLFYLYSTCKDKNEIIRIFNKVVNCQGDLCKKIPIS